LVFHVKTKWIFFWQLLGNFSYQTKTKNGLAELAHFRQKKVETKRKNIFDSIHVLSCIWWIHLGHFGNYVKLFCRTNKSPLWIGFQIFFVVFLWCVLLPKGVFDMGPISSFAQINWNDLQLKFWKLLERTLWHPYLFHLSYVLPPMYHCFEIVMGLVVGFVDFHTFFDHPTSI
jgi:hypothetical protein